MMNMVKAMHRANTNHLRNQLIPSATCEKKNEMKKQQFLLSALLLHALRNNKIPKKNKKWNEFSDPAPFFLALIGALLVLCSVPSDTSPTGAVQGTLL